MFNTKAEQWQIQNLEEGVSSNLKEWGGGREERQLDRCFEDKKG